MEKKNDEVKDIETLTDEKEKEVKKKIKKSKKKFKMKKNLKIMFISLGVILVVGIAILIVYFHYKNLNKVTVEDYELYQYFGNMRFDYTGKFSMKKNGEITKIEYEDVEIEADSTPIYYKNIDNEIILPKSMAIVFPRLINKNYKLPYFSRISIDYSMDDSSAFWKVNEKNLYLENSFLYDGANLYVFLYETKVTIDGVDYVLSPLSYVNVNYRADVTIYDKKNDKVTIIETHNDDVMGDLNGYKINLSTDMVLYDRDSKLLIKNVDNLQTYSN